MSYLSVPRLHFAGQFLTSPSTINNTPANYITTPTPPYPTYPPDVPTSSTVLWNPMGVARFLLNGSNVNGTPLSGVTIQSVMPPEGELVTPSNSDDPLIGASIQTSTDDSPAKIVDLDPDQQLATLFIGIRLQLVLQGGTVAFSMKPGEYLQAPNLTDYSGLGKGVFESRINPKQIDWNPDIDSPLFHSFMMSCRYGISVKFIIDSYDTSIDSPTFNFGRIVGALGPAKRGEPVRASVGRKFIPPSVNTHNNSGYFQLDTRRKKLVIDFGNSAHFDYSGGKSPEINAAILVRRKIVNIGGPLQYSAQNYIQTAGILEIPLSSAEMKSLQKAPLRFYQSVHSLAVKQPTMILSEFIAKRRTDFPTGTYVTISQLSSRLSYGESGKVELIARRFGQPLGGYTLNMGTVPRTSTKGITYPKTVETLRNGKATFNFTASPPPLIGERADIGSQMYYLRGKWQKTSFIGISFWPVNFASLSVKAYAEYNAPANPTWYADVQPVMTHFMTLYPGMKKMHDMSNYSVVKNLGSQLVSVFSIPIDNPGYMPVTRELNPAVMAMVVKWVNQGMVEGTPT